MHKLPTYPKDHKPGMVVPRGGSMCLNCKFYSAPKPASNSYGTCSEENFVSWNGSAEIPNRPDEYCSDWYMPRK